MICEKTGKETFATKKLALNVTRRNKTRKKIANRNKGRQKVRVHIKNGVMFPYICEHCGLWHISGTRHTNPNKYK